MFFRKKFIFLFIFSLFFTLIHASENSTSEYKSGTDICDSFFSYLDEKKLYPIEHEIISSSVNTFPYNITFDINSKKKDDKNNLLLVFSLHEAEKKNDINLILFYYIKKSDFVFNTTFLFSYESDIDLLSDFSQISGNEIYINSLDTNKDFIVLKISLNKKNYIISSSRVKTSPDWLIKTAYDSFVEEKIAFEKDFIYTSFFDKILNKKDSTIDLLFTTEIKSIGLSFNTNDNISSILNVLKKTLTSCNTNFSLEWTEHLLGFLFHNKNIWFSELFLVKTLMIILSLLILIILTINLINSAVKKILWVKLKSVWFIIPFFLLITYFSFYLFYDFQLIPFFITFILISVFIFFTKNRINLQDKHSFYMLIFISSSINLAIFSLMDISLFLLFFPIFIFSFLTILFRKNLSHLFLSICILIYTFSLLFLYYRIQFTYIDLNLFQNKYLTSIEMAFLLSPTLFLWYRIITRVKDRLSSFLTYGFSLLIASVFLFVVIIGNLSIIKKQRIINENEAYSFLIDSNSDKIRMESSTEQVFSDIVRNISIDIGSNPLFCQLIVSSKNDSFIFYSDDDFEILSTTSNQFIIPSYPPQIMLFSFGSNVENLDITIKVLYNTEIDNEYILSEKSVSFGE